MFGIERLKALLGIEQTKGIDAVLHEVEEAVRRFRGNHEPMDDATMMALAPQRLILPAGRLAPRRYHLR